MTNEKTIEQLEVAQEKIYQAIELIEAATSGTEDARGVKEFILPNLRGLCGDNEHRIKFPIWNIEEMIREQHKQGRK